MTHLATSLSLLSLVLGIFLTLSIWRRTVYQRASNKATMHRSISQTAIVRYFQVLSFGHLISLDTRACLYQGLQREGIITIKE